MKRIIKLSDDVVVSIKDIMYVERSFEGEKPAVKMYMHGIPSAFLYTFNGIESRDSVFELIVRRMKNLNFDCNCNIHGMVSTEPE